MTMVAILPVPVDSASGGTVFHAVAGDRRSQGRTAGAALDALTAQFPADEGGDTLVIVRTWRPDEFFGAASQRRLGELMSRWRAARDEPSSRALSADESRELDELVELELRASAARASALVDAVVRE